MWRTSGRTTVDFVARSLTDDGKTRRSPLETERTDAGADGGRRAFIESEATAPRSAAPKSEGTAGGRGGESAQTAKRALGTLEHTLFAWRRSGLIFSIFTSGMINLLCVLRSYKSLFKEVTSR